MNRLFKTAIFAALVVFGIQHNQIAVLSEAEAKAEKTPEQVVAEAFKSHRGNFQVKLQATVAKVLADDTQGLQHQRFLIQLSNGLTLLVAHNIGIAPRVDNLHESDPVELYGEYEWNNKGGVIHWTHHDPSRRHLAGWIKHAGQLYQ